MCFPTSAAKMRGPLENSSPLMGLNIAELHNRTRTSSRMLTCFCCSWGHYLGLHEFSGDTHQMWVLTLKLRGVASGKPQFDCGPRVLRYCDYMNTEWVLINKATHTVSLGSTHLLFLSGKIAPPNWSQHHRFICWCSVLINHTHSCVSTTMRNILWSGALLTLQGSQIAEY